MLEKQRKTQSRKPYLLNLIKRISDLWRLFVDGFFALGIVSFVRDFSRSLTRDRLVLLLRSSRFRLLDGGLGGLRDGRGGSFSSGDPLLLFVSEESSNSKAQSLVRLAHIGSKWGMAANGASLRQSFLTVLANRLVATLQLECVDGKFGTNGTSQFDGDLGLREGAVRMVSE